ncbi:conjugal transfer protein TraG N-terminal domain-containing protein [Entomomonas sp. E2T0]|uniref:conjugal transfer protein TraG N-terminal domain-containing protein n=1 Tax=Entomomonas sp. E2T0 TaxID=2930213 RepID=UPI0022283775|nr:conjugal transfer protein TraG N-terminal domain-containing protein [Entomomonas sp. E2T0]UYZ83048.1 conjugal transfer protein TraG N-terminal domain-containing protein [Entomomonas sp. E2T0]
MTTNSFLEYYLTLLAWIINNSIWNTLFASGIFALPLAAILIEEWITARGEGADEGNKGVLALARIENRLFIAYVVIIFCCMPTINISLEHMKFDSSRSTACGVSVPEPSETGYATSFEMIGDQSASVPIWWFLVHSISKGISAAATASIPCSPDIRQISMEVDTTRIEDPMLLQEVYDFTNDCYGITRARLFHNKPTLTDEQAYDVKWIGSDYLLNTSGYYDSSYSKVPRKSWPWNETRDSGRARVANGAGYPTCKQWWADSGIGLRARLVSAVDPTLWTRLKGWITWSSSKDIENATLRQLVSPEHQKKAMSTGEIFKGYGASGRPGYMNGIGHGINNSVSNVGLLVDKAQYYPRMNAIRTALPMIQSFLIMAMIIALPILMVISTYNLKTVFTITFGMFTLHFLTFWWELARWADSSLLTALYKNESWGSMAKSYIPVANLAMDGTVQSQVMDFVNGSLFIVLPMFFLSAMAWAGYHVGSAVGGLMEKGSGAAGDAAASGANVTKQIATAAVKTVATGKPK